MLSIPSISDDSPAGAAGEPTSSECTGDGPPRLNEVKALQRRRLLVAAAQVLDQRGAARLTTGQICQRAGVARKSFYEHFGGVEECVLAALRDAVGRVAAVAVPAYNSHSAWRESMRAGLAATLVSFDEDPLTARLCIVHALAAQPQMLAYREEVIKSIVEAVDRGRAEVHDGLGPPDSVLGAGIVGAVLGVIHSRLVGDDSKPLAELLNPLMSMIVLPYLGREAAASELTAPAPVVEARPERGQVETLQSALGELKMRLTHRTLRVLQAIADNQDASNRAISAAAGIADQGQTSRLLQRLQSLGLIRNGGGGSGDGSPNAWRLTAEGSALLQSAQSLAEPVLDLTDQT